MIIAIRSAGSGRFGLPLSNRYLSGSLSLALGLFPASGNKVAVCVCPLTALVDNSAAPVFVCFWTKADKSGFCLGTVCPLMTQSGHFGPRCDSKDAGGNQAHMAPGDLFWGRIGWFVAKAAIWYFKVHCKLPPR
jgi:hypothetical protein